MGDGWNSEVAKKKLEMNCSFVHEPQKVLWIRIWSLLQFLYCLTNQHTAA